MAASKKGVKPEGKSPVKKTVKALIKKADEKTKRKKKRNKRQKGTSCVRTKNKYGLTPLQTNFCNLYVTNGNMADAYIESGYKATKATAHVNSSKLLNNTKIQSYIKYLMEKAEDEAIAKPKEILKFLTQVARGEIPDQWSDKPSVKDRMEAVKLLGKRHGLFNDKIEVAVGGKVEHVHRPAVADELIEAMFIEDDIIDAEVVEVKEIETDSKQVS